MQDGKSEELGILSCKNLDDSFVKGTTSSIIYIANRLAMSVRKWCTNMLLKGTPFLNFAGSCAVFWAYMKHMNLGHICKN